MKDILYGGLLLSLLLWGTGGIPPASAETALTLDTALSRVLERNPHLQAADLAWQASEARVDQAGRRPNPELEMGWEDLAGTGELSGFGSSGLNLMLSQDFELGGKRGYRQDWARGQTRLSDWERRSLHLDLICWTKEAFLAVWAAQSRSVLASEQRQLFAELLQESQRRVTAGAASAVELSRARASLAAAEMDCRRSDQYLATACRRLAAMWNCTEPDFAVVTGDFETVALTMLPTESEELIFDNPDLGHWRSLEALQQVTQNLARAAGTPDLNLGLGIKRYNETGDQAFVLGVGLPLPLFDRKEGEIRAAEYELEQIRRQAAAVEIALRTELALARQEQQAALDEVGTLREEIIPLATAAFDATLEGHHRGLFSFTDVLETRSFLFELRQSYIDALARHHLADARIQRLLGADDPQSATTTTTSREESR